MRRLVFVEFSNGYRWNDNSDLVDAKKFMQFQLRQLLKVEEDHRIDEELQTALSALIRYLITHEARAPSVRPNGKKYAGKTGRATVIRRSAYPRENMQYIFTSHEMQATAG